MISNRLLLNTFYKGRYPSSREFTILKDNKFNYKISLIYFVTISFLLSYMFNYSNDKLQLSFYVILILIFSVLLIYNIFFIVENETVLLIVPIAIQLTTTYISGRQTVKSIPWFYIGDLMILDIIVGQQVLFFLAVEVKTGESEFNHVILFRNTRPKLEYLERMYKEFQGILDTNR